MKNNFSLKAVLALLVCAAASPALAQDIANRGKAPMSFLHAASASSNTVQDPEANWGLFQRLQDSSTNHKIAACVGIGLTLGVIIFLKKDERPKRQRSWFENRYFYIKGIHKEREKQAEEERLHRRTTKELAEELAEDKEDDNEKWWQKFEREQAKQSFKEKARQWGERGTPAHSQHSMSRENALNLMGLLDGATNQDIRTKYKFLARQIHPDKVPRGLDKDSYDKEISAANEKMQNLIAARDVLLNLSSHSGHLEPSDAPF